MELPSGNNEPVKRPTMRTRRNTTMYQKPQKPYQPVSNKPVRVLNRNNDQLSITNFFAADKSLTINLSKEEDTISTLEDCIFGWTTMGDDIPYIVKQSEKYCAIRMIEHKALAKYLKLIPRIGFCEANIECFQATKAQCKLLNEINDEHCNSEYGPSFTTRDVLVRLNDANKYFQFVEACQYLQKTNSKVSQTELDFGFILVNKTSYVLYTKFGKHKFIPLIYLKCDASETLDILKSKSETISGEKALFLKLCCKYDGTWNEQLDKEIEVIGLDDLKKCCHQKLHLKAVGPQQTRNISCYWFGRGNRSGSKASRELAVNSKLTFIV